VAFLSNYTRHWLDLPGGLAEGCGTTFSTPDVPNWVQRRSLRKNVSKDANGFIQVVIRCITLPLTEAVSGTSNLRRADSDKHLL
jgi:hypothetical protein